ncbi:MAG: 50S ribosomal protein L13 [Myxococcales bacterium]|nr:50S ribosomal protein L13 [Myxococcales bacterium]
MGTTKSAKANEIERRWFVVDASNQSLGRLASEVAKILRGKHRPEYTPHVDTGDFVIVVNAEKVGLTGNKTRDKMYYNHSGYPGGLRAEAAGDLLARRPTVLIERAVRGMLPKNSLGRAMGKKLKVYAGASHPHTAQKPEPLSF